MATKDELKVLFATGEEPTGADFALLIDGVEGAKGEAGADGSAGVDGIQGVQGDDGVQGIQGETGVAGTDGYVTQEMYEALVARLDALETP